MMKIGCSRKRFVFTYVSSAATKASCRRELILFYFSWFFLKAFIRELGCLEVSIVIVLHYIHFRHKIFMDAAALVMRWRHLMGILHLSLHTFKMIFFRLSAQRTLLSREICKTTTIIFKEKTKWNHPPQNDFWGRSFWRTNLLYAQIAIFFMLNSATSCSTVVRLLVINATFHAFVCSVAHIKPIYKLYL